MSEVFHLFARVDGEGPWLTFLHGFPTCSWDWAKIVEPMQQHHRLLTFDFLGFGGSEKPRAHRYSIFEQADLVEAMWEHYGIRETGLVAHDYGDTVALELLARLAESRLPTRITRTVLLNGGIYVDLARPLLSQILLRQPIVGALCNRFINRGIFNRQFGKIFSPKNPIEPGVLFQYWQAILLHKGKRNYHRLIRYMRERKKYQQRWEGILESGKYPIHFIWGLDDPVSGQEIAEHIRRRLPQADLLMLPEIGHYPQLEAPDVVTDKLLRIFK